MLERVDALVDAFLIGVHPQFKAKSRLKAGEQFTMGIDVGLLATRFLIDGEVIGKIDGPPSISEGRIGVTTSDTPVRFLNPRLTR